MAQKTESKGKRAPHLSFYRETYAFEGQTVVLEHLELAIVAWEKKCLNKVPQYVEFSRKA